MRIPRGVPALLGCILGWTVLWVDVLLTPGVPAQERAFALRTAVWDTRDIPVCWENPTEADRQGRQWTREAVQDTWERASHKCALSGGRRVWYRVVAFVYGLRTRAPTSRG